MKELTTDELKTVEFQILIAVRNFCDEKGIRYYLGYGTLLGAVRHSGFIPWDDDIDICMPREDYERFIVEFHQSERYSVISYKKNDEYYLPFAKVIDRSTILEEQLVRSVKGLGAYIDIFPIDGLGNTLSKAKRTIRTGGRLFFFGWLRARHYIVPKHPKDIIKNMAVFCSRITKNFCYEAIKMIGEKHCFDDSKYVGCIFSFCKERDIMERELYNECRLYKFENETFKGPNDYDTYLKRIYGDYMLFPPAEERITHHSFKVYWKDE